MSLHTGHMYLFGERKSAEDLSLFLTVIANVIIPVSNVLIAYIYWTPVYPMFLCAPLLTVDVFYHIVLINWYLSGINGNMIQSWNINIPDNKQPGSAPGEASFEDHDEQQFLNQAVAHDHLEAANGLATKQASLSLEIPVHYKRDHLHFENIIIETTHTQSELIIIGS